MNVLTDCPDALGGFFSTPPSWGRVLSTDLDDALCSLWTALSESDSLHVTEVDPPVRCRGISSLAIVEKAPGSQFDALLQALEADRGLPPGSAAVALEGRGFHGRRGRSWVAKRGNIHLSVYHPLAMEARDVGAGLTALPAVSVVDAIQTVYGDCVQPRIKWVNDILVEDSKVSGVLTTTRVKGTRIEQVVFGLGVNVDSTPQIPPDPFVPASASLNAACGVDAATPGEVLWALLAALDRRFRDFLAGGPGSILDAYREHSGVIGRAVRVFEEADEDDAETRGPLLAAGVVERIDDDLALCIRGCADRVTRGRLAFADVKPGGA